MRRLAAVLVVTLAAALLPHAARPAQPEAISRADQLTAAYIVNFAKFVEWPAHATPDILTLCIEGADGVRGALLAHAGEKLFGHRSLTLRAIRSSDSLEGCDVLFVDAHLTTPVRMPPLSSGASPRSVLTIGDQPEFAHHGGVIELFTQDNRLRFKVNVGNAKRAGLHISSALLELASSVEKDSQ